MKQEVNNPKHYNNQSKEVIEMMIDIWGIDATINFCEMNAFKYRMRMGLKEGNDPLNDLEKALWYENKAKQLIKEDIIDIDDLEE